MVNFRNIRDEGIINVANAAERLTIATEGTIVCQTSDNTLWLFNNGVWNSLGGGGGGAVSSVTNTDGTLSISPSTGAVVANMANSGVTAGSYLVTGATIDSKGRVTAAQENYYLTIVNALIFG
jgi:hypothetical protein